MASPAGGNARHRLEHTRAMLRRAQAACEERFRSGGGEASLFPLPREDGPEQE